MLSIRLLTGATSAQRDAEGSAIGARLRGACIESSVADLDDCLRAADGFEALVALNCGSGAGQTEPIERCLHAGKHVLLAGVPGFTIAELEEFSASADESGVQFAVVNPDHYLPSRQLVKQHLGQQLGDIGLVRMHRWEPAGSSAQHECAGLQTGLVRDLEQLIWLAVQKPNVVFAHQLLANETSRFIQVHLGFPIGMALIDFDNRLPPGADYRSFSVIGTTGAAYDDDQHNVQLLYQGGLPQAVRTGEGLTARVSMIQAFADAIAAGQDLSPGIAHWRDVFAVVDAVRASLATGEAVPLEGD